MCAGGMMAMILVSLPVTPYLWRGAASVFGPRVNALGYAVLFLLALCFAIYLIRHRDGFDVSKFFLLVGIAAIYYLLLRYHCRFPAERLHLFEYGLLAYLSYRALMFDFSRMKAYELAFLMSSLFGLVDEVIQHALPNRVFEWRDVVTNVIASALGLIVAALLTRETAPAVSSSETNI